MSAPLGGITAWVNRRIAAHGRLRAGLRLVMFGSAELASSPHSPLLKAGSGTCACRRPAVVLLTIPCTEGRDRRHWPSSAGQAPRR